MSHPIDPVVRDMFLRIEPVGSRVTCIPAPTDTDQDFLCMAAPDIMLGMGENERVLIGAGWHLGGSLPTDETAVPDHARFWSYTKGEVNIIVTRSEEFFRRFMAATSVSKRLNLLNKDDRIALFQAVLYGNY